MLVVANWKAYVDSAADAAKLFALSKRLASPKIAIVLAPAAPHLGFLAKGNRSKVTFAAQDVSVATRGAHTGETTASVLADLGVKYVIVGHSERRAAGEGDALIAQKAKAAIAEGMTPILCIGETHRDPDAKYLAGLRAQLASVFGALHQKDRSKLVIAYEPIWAIGKSASEAITPHDLTEMVLYIRKLLEQEAPGSARRMKILYGGSAEPENAKALYKGTGIDGFLVGHASVESKSFSALVKELA